jgi:Mn-dependent DtxR family transcriptional regulator
MKTYREENYLKAIYQLANHDKNKTVSPTDIANWLEVKPPTVLEKLAILVKKSYVTYNKFDTATRLTSSGSKKLHSILCADTAFGKPI